LSKRVSCDFATAMGELGGPGDLVIQDRFVANTQGSSSLKIGRLSRHESWGTFVLVSM